MQEVAGREFEENPEAQHNPVIGKELYVTNLCGGYNYMHTLGKVHVYMGVVLYSACGIGIKNIFSRELRWHTELFWKPLGLLVAWSSISATTKQ